MAFAGAEGEGSGAAMDALSAPGVYPISDELITVTALANVDTRIQDITTNYAVTWLEEQTNLHIEWDQVTGSDAAQKINLVLAAGSDLPDMIINSGITTEQQFLYGSQGFLAPLEGTDRGAHRRAEAHLRRGPARAAPAHRARRPRLRAVGAPRRLPLHAVAEAVDQRRVAGAARAGDAHHHRRAAHRAGGVPRPGRQWQRRSRTTKSPTPA